MHRVLYPSVAFLTLCALINGIAAHHDPDRVCSVKQPTSSQVCISIKFPWKENPVFFCTDYSQINYTPQCVDPNQSHHCYDDGRNDTLKIATPWDCCPLISTPNRCSNVECPPKPFNRTCQEMKTLGACCPTYFCDSGEPDNCKTKRLRADCVNPPKNKTNCVAFRDPFGCCNKYQCKGEAKSGFCPSHTRRRTVKVEEKGTFTLAVESFVSGAKDTVNKVATTVKGTLETHGGTFGRKVSELIPVPFQRPAHKHMILRCTGDQTCPGVMKCCPRFALERSISHHKVIREHVNGVKRTTRHTSKAEYYKPQQRNNLVDGVCVEPDLEGTIYPETTTSVTQFDNDYISTSTPPAREASSPSSSTQNILEDLSTTPNQVTETISPTNPTITVTSPSPVLSTSIPVVTPTIETMATLSNLPSGTPPATTPSTEGSTFPSTEPPTVATTFITQPPAPPSSSPATPTPMPASSKESESTEDDKNTLVHE